MLMPDRRKQGRAYSCLKYMMIIFNVIFVILGVGALAVGIFMVVDRNFVTNITGSSFLAVGAYGLVVGGVITILVAFTGLIAGITGSKMMVIVYIGCQVLVFLILLISGILAGVFRTQIGDYTKEKMYDSLIKLYGHDQHLEWNRDVTWAWDQVQSRLQCCGVEYNGQKGYKQYRYSAWYKNQPELSHKITPMVPSSCCKWDPVTYRIMDQKTCQTFQMGPPKTEVGADNNALSAKDCYSQGSWFLMDHTAVVLGVAIGIALLLIGGILTGIFYLRELE